MKRSLRTENAVEVKSVEDLVLSAATDGGGRLILASIPKVFHSQVSVHIFETKVSSRS